MKKHLLLICLLSICSFYAWSQFEPQVYQPGNHAIHKDDTLIKAWAAGAVFEPGWIQITDTLLGKVNSSNINNVLGKADSRLISMGDGGMITFTFSHPVVNAEGADFLVFENGFLNVTDSALAFLELAFVEVSSNGTDFVRFPATSHIPDSVQYDNFSFTNAEHINNLAGKYIQNWGTPFDLEELKDEPNLDVNNITHIRIIDVVGILDEDFGSKDSRGQLINDPFPTPFPSCGFDINAIGVLHNQDSSSNNIAIRTLRLNIYPNPASAYLKVENDFHIKNASITILNIQGQIIHHAPYNQQDIITIDALPQGSYIIKIQNEQYVYQTKFIKL